MLYVSYVVAVHRVGYISLPARIVFPGHVLSDRGYDLAYGSHSTFSKHLLWVLISHDMNGCYDRSCEQAGTGSFAQQQFLQLLEHSHIL